MRFDDRDRRRLGLATVVTIVALPAVWLANRDDPTSRPNVAAVGLAPEDGAATTAPDPAAIDPMGAPGPQYLEGGSLPPVAPTVPVAVGTSDEVVVADGRAIFRRSVGDVDACRFGGLPPGQRVTVVNIDNGRTTTCWTNPQPPGTPEGELVLHPERFREIADLTAAPVDIEIRQARE